MRPLVTCPQSKLAEVYFRFKKIADITDICEETYEKANERFESVYVQAVTLTNKLDTEEK